MPRMKLGISKPRALLMLALFGSSLIAQNTTITITDSNGNWTTGTINNGNIYFHDSQGRSEYGTIGKDGNIFINTDKGEITFGTMRDGNIFLVDQNGITTGRIKNGNVFLSNSDGSITTGTYNGTITTTNTSVQQQIDQQNYETGAAVGEAIGSTISASIENHEINSYCKANPTSTVRLDNGINIQCPNAQLDESEQQEVESYCADNPGLWIAFGKHRVDCDTPPNPPNLKWAVWELKEWHWDYTHQHNKVVIVGGLTSDQMRSSWAYWRGQFCTLASSGAIYKDLDGKRQRCN